MHSADRRTLVVIFRMFFFFFGLCELLQWQFLGNVLASVFFFLYFAFGAVRIPHAHTNARAAKQTG